MDSQRSLIVNLPVLSDEKKYFNGIDPHIICFSCLPLIGLAFAVINCHL